jgi:GNAT superfamily N-acetyltransferase
MTWDEFDVWSRRSVRGAAEQQVTAGLLPEPEATSRAEQMFADLLPLGLATPLHLLLTARLAAGPETVAHLWMRVRPLADEVEAYVFDVEVDPGLRGRGLGRATIVAAEALGRTLDATVVRLNVFGHNTPARRLYDSLRYAVTSTAMTRRLDRPAPAGAAALATGPPLRLHDMTGEEFAALRPRMQADHAADMTRAGVLPASEAARRAADEVTRLLPDGPATAGHRLWTASDGDAPVGAAWVQLQERTDGRHAVAHRLWVAEGRSGLGIERSLVEQVEPWLSDLGVASLALLVLGDQPDLCATYEEAGFEVTAQTMAKVL